jgi:hypothetical protein
MGCGGECGDCSVVCVSRVQPMNKVRYLRYTGQVTNQYGTCDSERTSEGKQTGFLNRMEVTEPELQ